MPIITIRLTNESADVISEACRRAGIRETGGMLFGEHVSGEEFRVAEATVAGTGSIAGFVRGLFNGLGRLERFFSRTKHDYVRFNYLGEWHSHPSFELFPSAIDDMAMFDIVNDSSVGARFATLVIVKLDDVNLQARAFVYFPGAPREDGCIVIDKP
jgi:proteasome lid subunit RPN8/RPN11